MIPHLSDKAKQTIKTIAVWAVVLSAYSYLGYTLWTTDWATLNMVTYEQWWLPALCILLMPLNILLESVKWRYLVHDLYPMTILEAQKQVYYGFVGSFITPYRAGDYPSRVLLMTTHEHWGKAIARGVYGSVVLTAVIILAGLLPFWAYVSDIAAQPWMWLTALIPIPFCLFKSKHNSTPGKLTNTYLWSLARYIVFSLQLYLMLRWTGLDIHPAEAMCRIPYYYLLVTITPNIPISDPAIRGSWAVIAFGPNGAIAALSLWVVNTILPLIIGGIWGIQRNKRRAK